MKPKSTKERPFWRVLLIGIGIGIGVGLGLSLLALIPLTVTTGSRPKRAFSPPVSKPASQTPSASAAQSAQPGQASPPSVKSSDQQGTLPESEINSYQGEMRLLQEKAKINQDTAKQMSDMGAPERGIELINEAVQMTQISRCLKNQMNRGVPFYEGKATCLASVPADR